jgi:hypothetical protein
LCFASVLNYRDGFHKIELGPVKRPESPDCIDQSEHIVLSIIVYSSQRHWSPCLTIIRIGNEAECSF